VRDRLRDALRRATADYADVRFETEDATSVAFRGPELDAATSRVASGGIARACTKGGWGLAVFDSLDDLAEHVQEACRCAALVGTERTELAEVEPPADATLTAEMARDPRGVPLSEKLDQVGRYNRILLESDPAVETTHVSYAESFRTVHFASTRGAYFREERPFVRLYVSAVARDGSLVQRASDYAASATTYDVVLGMEQRVEEAGRRAAALLRAAPCPGGSYTVVLDTRLGGVFAHEAFGHLSEADFLYENPQMRELMHLGRPLGGRELSIVDGGAPRGLPGSHAFDDEGTPTRKTDLIREGVLVGHLHSLETAAKMGETPTGNARAMSRGFAPLVRMTSTYIEPGTLTFEQLLSGVDHGLYACGTMGGQTEMEVFTFSAEYARRIENGQLGELVRDVVLTGNVFDTLYAIDGLGRDLELHPGGCGKGAQSSLPVSFGAPPLRLRGVVVGGR